MKTICVYSWFHLLLVVAFVMAMTACADHKQVQYFAVKDPDTGAASYYRMTIKGNSTIARYNMQAGYFSNTAVDVLRGQMPSIPTLDLPIERIDAMDRLLEQMDKGLLQEAKRIYPVSDPAVVYDVLTGRIAALSAAVNSYADNQTKLNEAITSLADLVKNKNSDDLEKAIKTAQKAVSDAEGVLNEKVKLRKEATDDAAKAMANEAVNTAVVALEAERKGLSDARTSLKAFIDNTSQLAAKRLALSSLETLHPKNQETLRLMNERKIALAKAHPDAALGIDPVNPIESQANFDDTYIRLARLIWLQSLSTQDVASIGLTLDMNPYQFRKLVFWSTAAAVNLNQVAGSIDSIADQVVQIADGYKQIRKQRKVDAAAKKEDEKASKDKVPGETDTPPPSGLKE